MTNMELNTDELTYLLSPEVGPGTWLATVRYGTKVFILLEHNKTTQWVAVTLVGDDSERLSLVRLRQPSEQDHRKLEEVI